MKPFIKFIFIQLSPSWKRTYFLFATFYLFVLSTASAQVQQPMNTGELLLGLKKAGIVGSVLYIAAHPDDENTRLIAYLAKERCYRTGYLSITRGDGGQNLIGTEQGELLGLVRTNELLQARKTDGGEQFFTSANDFGYSKNPEETFKFWDKEKILGDVVWVIRNFRPDVIICRFPTTGEGGHGHHTASAILAEEAFDAAADTTRFPEQLHYVKPWKTKRLFWNTFNFGGTNTTSPNQLKIDVGIYNPLLGKGYGEIASESRSMHKSQGFGSARTRGSQLEYFKQLKGDSVKYDLFENINTTWNSIDKSKKIDDLLLKTKNNFDPFHTIATIKDLNLVYDAIQQLPSSDATNRWKELKSKEVVQLLTAVSGLWMEAYSENNTYSNGDSLKMSAVYISRLTADASVKNISFLERSTLDDLSQIPLLNKTDTINFKVKLADTFNTSNPYWLNATHAEGHYSISDLQLIGKPLNDEPLKVKFTCDIGGHLYEIFRPTVYKSTDPVKGELYQPLEILPKATVNFSDKAFIFSNGTEKKITLIIKANTKDVKGKLSFNANESWTIEPSTLDFNFKNKGDEESFSFKVKPNKSDNNTFILQANLLIENKIYSKSIVKIEYDHIPHQFILSDATAKLVNIDLKTVKKNIGYIEGAGDNVSESLQQMGYHVTELTDEMLSNNSLDQYQTIVTGIRAYNTKDRLQLHYDKLMKYIADGGTLIVQYNTNNRIGPVIAKIGPYPFTISRDRVTDENADVNFLQPNHPLLNSPNKITTEDFKGWKQERGIYFVSDCDSNYTSLISMHDPGEKDAIGSIIAANYGKGHFIYTGLVFFRELPAGIPGAYRLFANMMEY